MTCKPEQIRKLIRNSRTKTLAAAAARAGMSENTARQYVKRGGKPLMRKPREYRTRHDPFGDVWSDLANLLDADAALEPKILMEWLMERYPNRFKPSQVRTLQRRIREWRALHGPDKEVMFQQDLVPGRQSQSDYTWCNELNVTIDGNPFPHMLFHFILPYSRWETVSIAFSESLESLTQGYAAAVKELGAVALEHRTDNLAAAVPIGAERKTFQRNWRNFLAYYGVQPSANNPRQSHENGSVEKSHDLLKKALDQRLRLRGSRNFATQSAYEEFVQTVIYRRNKDRSERLAEELRCMSELPRRDWRDPKEMTASVSPWSTVVILRSTYSVPSRLIGSKLRALVHHDHIELYFGTKEIQRMQRIRPGEAAINYRHVIGHLVRKPGAFPRYRFREELFPTLVFRKAFDKLNSGDPQKGHVEYLRILNLAAMNSECSVERALQLILQTDQSVTAESVKELITTKHHLPAITVLLPNLADYDNLLTPQKEGVPA
jgi:hypothetical protein